jgi:hypothetical protein
VIGRRFALLSRQQRSLTLAVLAAAAVPQWAFAQDRLISTSVAAVGVVVDQVSFGKGGYLQPGVFGGDSLRARSLQQVGLPVSVTMSVGQSWTVDVQTLLSRVSLDYVSGGARASTGVERSATLSGMSDVRTRVTGRLLNDAVVLTLGANLPTGRTKLDGSDFLVLQTAAAPSLGLGSPPVGTGPSGTMGVVAARQLWGGALAGGISLELRGTYQPIAALVAGAPSADFRPGNVTRFSLGYDRLVGRHRLVASAAADIFRADVLTDRSVQLPVVSAVRLGPVYTADAQLHLAVARVREFVLWGSNRFRERFERDGLSVDGSNGNYLDGGLRTRVPMSRRLDLLVTTDLRHHSGLAINQGLATARSTSAGATLGLVVQAGPYSIQPYLRGRSGSVQPRADNATSISFSGASAGLVLLTRF